MEQLCYQGKTFQWRRFTQKENPNAFDQAIQLRRDVFVTEQEGPLEEEPDQYDAEALHWLLSLKNSTSVIGTARVVNKVENTGEPPVAKIGRIAVAKHERGQNLGFLMVEQILSYLQLQGYTQALLHAQTYAIRFYQKLGFEAEGEEFIEDGILHIKMRKRLTDENDESN